MNTKTAFDIAEILGLYYSPQCTWIDLYLNGEYSGIYLLTESVSAGAGRVEITDLEKILPSIGQIVSLVLLFKKQHIYH